MVYRVDLSYACYEIATNSYGVVTEAALIAKWMVGKRIAYVFKWVQGKGGTIEPIQAMEG